MSGHPSSAQKPRRTGRPRGPNRARGEAAVFFARIDALQLTFEEVREQLESAGETVPSYRALQEWRSGGRTSRFAPFALWTAQLSAPEGEE